jgi:hypothetical protein
MTQPKPTKIPEKMGRNSQKGGSRVNAKAAIIHVLARPVKRLARAADTHALIHG